MTEIVVKDTRISIVASRLLVVSILARPRRGRGRLLFWFSVEFALHFTYQRRPALSKVIADDWKVVYNP
jgi:hypothetical protein